MTKGNASHEGHTIDDRYKSSLMHESAGNPDSKVASKLDTWQKGQN